MAAAAEHGVGVMARVPTSSGLLDDNLTLETTFGPGDHRRHRPREWLVEGLQKIDRIRFLCGPESGRTMAQAALRFILAQPQMAVVIPTITNEAELREYAGADRRSGPDRGRARPRRRALRAQLRRSSPSRLNRYSCCRHFWMSACDFAWATQFWYEELLLPPPELLPPPGMGSPPVPPTPGTPRPESRAEPRRSAIGFALDGPVIVCALVDVAEREREVEVDLRDRRAGARGWGDRQRHGQLGEEVVVGVRVDIDRGGLYRVRQLLQLIRADLLGGAAGLLRDLLEVRHDLLTSASP